MSLNRITKEMEVEILAMRRDRKSLAAIGAAVGISKYSIGRFLRARNAPRTYGLRAPSEYVCPPLHRDTCADWGRWLREKRTEAKIDCQVLASMAGVSPSSITLYQRGGIPPRHVAAAIGRALEAEEETLIRCGYIPARFRDFMIEYWDQIPT